MNGNWNPPTEPAVSPDVLKACRDIEQSVSDELYATQHELHQTNLELARLHRALTEAVAQVLEHNAEYAHITPPEKIAEWRAALAEISPKELP